MTRKKSRAFSYFNYIFLKISFVSIRFHLILYIINALKTIVIGVCQTFVYIL